MNLPALECSDASRRPHTCSMHTTVHCRQEVTAVDRLNMKPATFQTFDISFQ